MRIRLLVTALAYAVYLFALLLFPPFHDGLHHWYSWQPDEVQVISMIPSWASPAWVIAHLDSLSHPDYLQLTFESLNGLVIAVCAFLLLSLIALFRDYHQLVGNFATLVNFLFITTYNAE